MAGRGPQFSLTSCTKPTGPSQAELASLICGEVNFKGTRDLLPASLLSPVWDSRLLLSLAPPHQLLPSTIMRPKHPSKISSWVRKNMMQVVSRLCAPRRMSLGQKGNFSFAFHWNVWSGFTSGPCKLNTLYWEYLWWDTDDFCQLATKSEPTWQSNLTIRDKLNKY
jgi:hypothetical protein